MPITSPNMALQRALQSYLTDSGSTASAVAREFSMSPMTLGRFLASGRMIRANQMRLAEALAKVGYWVPEAPTSSLSGAISREDYDKVIALLEFLLVAARRHANEMALGNGVQG